MEKDYKLNVVLYKTLVIVDNFEEEFDNLNELDNIYSRMLYSLDQMKIEHDSISVHISKRIKLDNKEHEVEISNIRLYKNDIINSYINLDNTIINITKKYFQAKFEESLSSLII